MDSVRLIQQKVVNWPCIESIQNKTEVMMTNYGHSRDFTVGPAVCFKSVFAKTEIYLSNQLSFSELDFAQAIYFSFLIHQYYLTK